MTDLPTARIDLKAVLSGTSPTVATTITARA